MGNVGSIDRILRVVVGAALVAYAMMGPESSWKVFTWIGVVPLATGLFGFCPLYKIIGIGKKA